MISPDYNDRDSLAFEPLSGLRVVTLALNLPGPVACARLRDLGAAVTKIEPPSGDPFEGFCRGWYARLHSGIEVRRIDLKSADGRANLESLLDSVDLLVTAQRPAALARLGLSPQSLAAHPRLCHVAIVGHPPPHEDQAGHDLTYVARHGLLSPPHLPSTLFADMAGAERAVSAALAVLMARERSGRASSVSVSLEDAAGALAQPLHEGLTAPGALLGGGYAGYNLYAAQAGWIAVAALEPHFAARLAAEMGLAELDHDALRERFASRPAAEWQRWAQERDLPIVALPSPEFPS